jgi:hypothetical protein
LRYVNEVAARVPSVAALAATDESGMTDIFGAELDQLGGIVMEIFKRGGLEEFAYYLPDREVTGKAQMVEASGVMTNVGRVREENDPCESRRRR